MNWKNAVNHAKDLMEKNGVSSGECSEVDLPLGARIGSFVQLQKAPFIRAISGGSFIEIPNDENNFIRSISRVHLNLSGSIYRYYLAAADTVVDTHGKDSFLQVYVNNNGDVTEVIYCSTLVRVVPETAEDQQIYMGLHNCGLGDKSYNLWRDQLDGLGYSETDLYAAFGEYYAIEYLRDAGDPEQKFIAPFKGYEIYIEDKKDHQGLPQDIYFMPYRRDINDWETTGNVEYLLITTKLVQCKSDVIGERKAHVDFMVGIPVDLERILIT